MVVSGEHGRQQSQLHDFMTAGTTQKGRLWAQNPATGQSLPKAGKRIPVPGQSLPKGKRIPVTGQSLPNGGGHIASFCTPTGIGSSAVSEQLDEAFTVSKSSGMWDGRRNGEVGLVLSAQLIGSNTTTPTATVLILFGSWSSFCMQGKRSPIRRSRVGGVHGV